MKLWYFFKLFVFLVIAGLAYQNRDQIVTNVRTAIHQYFPCTMPVTYTLGTFDTQFGLSREEFLMRIAAAEKIWEDVVGKELFQYVESGGDMTVNLIYDSRQETTEKLREIDENIGDKKENYESLKAEYDKLSAQLLQEKTAYEREVTQLKNLQNAYEREVNRANRRGGAWEEEYARLEKQRLEINSRIAQLDNSLSRLNNTIAATNALGGQVNTLVQELKLDVDTYNTTGKTRWEEFSEWEYVYDAEWKRINIYEFSDATKLARVLIHELGHAVQMKHVEESDAIMYRLNAGKNETITEADKAELRRVCRVK
jgi:chromosome segregation ATPase